MTRKSHCQSMPQVDEDNRVTEVTETAPPRKPHSKKKASGVRHKTRYHSDAEVIEALRRARGFPSLASEMLGMSARRVYERIQNSESMRLALEEIRERNLDVAECKLLEAVEKRQSWAVCFYLKCQGKKRGYIEQPRAVEFVAEGGGAALGLAYFDALLIDAEERRKAQQFEAKERSQNETDSAVVTDVSKRLNSA